MQDATQHRYIFTMNENYRKCRRLTIKLGELLVSKHNPFHSCVLNEFIVWGFGKARKNVQGLSSNEERVHSNPKAPLISDLVVQVHGVLSKQHTD